MRFLRPFLALSSIGLLGILSFIPTLGPEVEQLRQALRAPNMPSAYVIVMLLFSPTIFMLAMVAIGVALAENVGLSSIILQRLRGNPVPRQRWSRTLEMAGIAGAVLALIYIASLKLFPESLAQARAHVEQIQPQDLSFIGVTINILYDCVTAELIFRFGCVTLLIWIGKRLLGNRYPSLVIGIAILIPSLSISALMATWADTPDSAAIPMLAYHIIGIGLGSFYGWLYVFRGLEHAILAHVVVHALYLSITVPLAALSF